MSPTASVSTSARSRDGVRSDIGRAQRITASSSAHPPRAGRRGSITSNQADWAARSSANSSPQTASAIPARDAAGHVLTGEIARRRRQVVSGDGRETVFTPASIRRSGVFRAPCRSSSNHQNGTSSRQPTGPQMVPARSTVSQILAHHHRSRPVGLERDDADHRVVVITNVGALSRQRFPRIHQRRNRPMMWSIRPRRHCRRIVSINDLNGW